VDTNEPHLWGPLNDQIAYTNTARSLLTKGTLESNTVLPSTLWQKTTRDFLYMPGHPVTIAVCYKLFGVGAFQSIIPSLLSYLIAMLAIYLIGARIYSPSAYQASVLFALFPPVFTLCVHG
jgi:4-amino-4-deoxy-L-arabinose transferase-like glycosyltransferase